MKNAILNLAAFALLISTLTSCKKDPTFKEQLVGDWVSTKVKAGTTDLSGSNTFELRLHASSEFDLDITSTVPLSGSIVQSFSGDWDTEDTKQDITLTYNGSGQTKTWDVVNIGNTTLTTELVEDNIRYQVTFERR
jgi:hypothetical protein